MAPTREGALHIFRAFRIDVFVHWTWFLAAIYFMQSPDRSRGATIVAGSSYLLLFTIVLMHEFGHALACRQVGGMAHDIILWPLGGVAYVSPPHRPGAYLWSIAAGPLVNVALIPIFYGLLYWANHSVLVDVIGDRIPFRFEHPELYAVLKRITQINLFMVIFNLLPIYPLDGGKILQSLLWYRVGYRRSMEIAIVVGFVGCGCFALYGVYAHDNWMLILAAWAFISCRSAWMHSRGDF